jgi:hypothetical protein
MEISFRAAFALITSTTRRRETAAKLQLQVILNKAICLRQRACLKPAE